MPLFSTGAVIGISQEVRKNLNTGAYFCKTDALVESIFMLWYNLEFL